MSTIGDRATIVDLRERAERMCDELAQLRADLARAEQELADEREQLAHERDGYQALLDSENALRAERDALGMTLAQLSMGMVEAQHTSACYAPCDCVAFAMRRKAGAALVEIAYQRPTREKGE